MYTISIYLRQEEIGSPTRSDTFDAVDIFSSTWVLGNFLRLKQLEYLKCMMVGISFFSLLLAGKIVESHGGMSSIALWYPNLVGISTPTEGSVLHWFRFPTVAVRWCRFLLTG